MYCDENQMHYYKEHKVYKKGTMDTRQQRHHRRKATTKKGKQPSTPPLALKHKDYLTLLSTSGKNKSRRQHLLDAATSSEIHSVTECIKNLVQGNVPLGKKELQHLQRYKGVLRTLAQKCVATKEKRAILKQKGGFLAFLLPLAIKAVTGLFSSMLQAK